MEQLTAFLATRGMFLSASGVKREHLEAFVEDQLARWRPATAANRYRGIQRFFAWLAEEGELKRSPMERMKPPRVPDQPPPVIRDDDLKRLLATCERGQGFEDRRDAAILRVAASAGGISERTFYNWLECGRTEARGPYHDFVRSLEEASAASEMAAVATVRAASTRNWKAAIVFLERRFPERWRRRTSHEVTGADAGPVSIEARMETMSDAELAAEYERLVPTASRRGGSGRSASS